MAVFTDVQWKAMEPLIEAVRPQTGRELSNLRRTFEAIVWRLQNGAKWRAIPAELGPWWMAAQTFLRWSKRSAWPKPGRLRNQGPRACGRAGSGSGLRPHPRAGQRGATKLRSPRLSTRHPRLGCGRSRLLVSRAAHGGMGAGLQTGHPDKAQ